MREAMVKIFDINWNIIIYLKKLIVRHFDKFN